MFFKPTFEVLEANFIISFIDHFLDESNNKKYPKRVERSEPVNTPIFTPSMYSKLFTKAKFPTNKLIVNPIPVNIETPYRASHVEPDGLSANLSLTDIYESAKTPICFPKNKPKTIPRGTGLSKVAKVSPSEKLLHLQKQKVALFQKLHKVINHVLI